MTRLAQPILLLSIALLLGVTAISQAQVQNTENTWKLADGASSPPATIEDVSWLTGYWRGSGFGGECEEAFGDAFGDRILGWFSLRHGETLAFSLALTVVEVDGSLEVRVKHFNADFTGWEEKDKFVRFPLVQLGEQVAHFSGLTYRREGDALTIYIVTANGGETQENKLQLQRVQW